MAKSMEKFKEEDEASQCNSNSNRDPDTNEAQGSNVDNFAFSTPSDGQVHDFQASIKPHKMQKSTLSPGRNQFRAGSLDQLIVTSDHMSDPY